MAERQDDRELERRLGSALQQELRSGHVDVTELLRGTRRRTQRARVRRAAVLVAAATAVVAAPLGYAAAQRDRAPSRPAAAATSTPTAGAPTAEAPTAGPTADRPTAPTAPTGEPAVTAPPYEPEDLPPSPVAKYGIPADVMPSAKEIGRGSEVLDAAEYVNGPTLMGQACGEIPETRRPLHRRTLTTTDDARGSFQVDVVVTGWRDSDAAFRSLAEDSGSCRLSPGMEWSRATSAEEDYYFAAVGSSNGLQYGFAAQRLAGDVIVAVTVVDADRQSALSEAQRIVALTKDHAVTAGIAR